MLKIDRNPAGSEPRRDAKPLQRRSKSIRQRSPLLSEVSPIPVFPPGGVLNLLLVRLQPGVSPRTRRKSACAGTALLPSFQISLSTAFRRSAAASWPAPGSSRRRCSGHRVLQLRRQKLLGAGRRMAEFEVENPLLQRFLLPDQAFRFAFRYREHLAAALQAASPPERSGRVSPVGRISRVECQPLPRVGPSLSHRPLPLVFRSIRSLSGKHGAVRTAD